MSKQSFDALNSAQSSAPSNSAQNTSIGYFQLKNDGDEAIVRFIYDSTAQFDIYTTHTVSTPTIKFGKVNCLRDSASDPISKCPLCEAKEKLSQTFCVYMLQYTSGSHGEVEVKPVVWQRPMMFAQKLKSYIDNYGPLSDIICKIIRHGAAGNKQTEYEVVPNLSKAIFRDDIYVKDFSAFNNYTALGRMIMNKSFEDLQEYVRTKTFPIHNKNNGTTTAAKIEDEVVNPVKVVSSNVGTGITASSPAVKTEHEEVKRVLPWEEVASDNSDDDLPF